MRFSKRRLVILLVASGLVAYAIVEGALGGCMWRIGMMQERGPMN
jgi:hypothetical protein